MQIFTDIEGAGLQCLKIVFLVKVTYIRFMTKLDTFEDLPNNLFRLWFRDAFLMTFKLI